MTTEGIDVRSVGNSLTLHETALIEAFNLKAAIEYQLKNCEYSVWYVVWPKPFLKMFSVNFYGKLLSTSELDLTICDKMFDPLLQQN